MTTLPVRSWRPAVRLSKVVADDEDELVANTVAGNGDLSSVASLPCFMGIESTWVRKNPRPPRTANVVLNSIRPLDGRGNGEVSMSATTVRSSSRGQT